MAPLEHLKAQKAWADKWLSVPESELPGKLTHEKIYAELERVENELINHYCIQWNGKQWIACYR